MSLEPQKIKFTFRKYERISKKKEIDIVLKEGKKFFKDGLIVYILKRNPEERFSRIAILVSRKVEKFAVKRNKFKRRIREIFRLNKHKIAFPIDIVVIATINSVRKKFQSLSEIFLNILKEEKLFKEND